MAAGTVRVTGLKEVDRAFRKMEKTTSKELRQGLKKAGEPVAESGREKIGRYRGASVGTIRPRVGRGVSVFVTQNARKKSGKRGDFGVLQQRRLVEALDENKQAVITSVDEALGQMIKREGF